MVIPPSSRSVEYAKAAEKLGYSRVYLYDSPAVYTDIWIAMAQIAEATSTIGLGTGVSVPSLRHPMVTASAIATIEGIAPGRLQVAFGTGFTARKTMGQPSMKWADLATAYRQVTGLLRGEVVEIDGKPAQMLHMPGWAPARPINTPIWLAPIGPKGFAVSAELGAPGVVLSQIPAEPLAECWTQAAVIASGTVLREGEDHTSERIIQANGPWFASMYHGCWEMYPEIVESMPGGKAWLDGVVGLRPENERYLTVHEGHITDLTDRDRAGIAAAGDAILSHGWTGTPAVIAKHVQDAATYGATDIIYAPTGPNIIDEMTAFIAAAKS